MSDEFSNVPLFAELQRLLTTSTGPVNWELARQTAVATATAGGDPPAIGSFDEAVRIAELQLFDLAGIEPPAAATVSSIRRSTWVSNALALLPPVAEPAAARVVAGMDQFQPEEPDETAAVGPLGDLRGALHAVMSLLNGVQAGSLVGAVGATAFSGAELALPTGSGDLTFVEPSISTFEKDWELPPIEFRQWLAVREVAFRVALSPAWAPEHLGRAVHDAADGMEVDVGELRSRLEHLDLMGNPAGMQELIEGGDGLFEPILDHEQRLKVARVQAFVAICEGYPTHVTAAIAERILGGAPRIVEAVRRRDTGSAQVLPKLTGTTIDEHHLALGVSFCDTVADQTDEATLALVWTGPDALPSMPELEEPALWMARMA